jgi:hypothetical protein
MLKHIKNTIFWIIILYYLIFRPIGGVSKKPPPPHIAAVLENSPAGFFEKTFTSGASAEGVLENQKWV